MAFRPPAQPALPSPRARRLVHRVLTEARRVLLLRQGVVRSPRNRACGAVERRQLVLAAPIMIWFRHHLRLGDHPALAAAANTSALVLPLYILDDTTPGRWRMGATSHWWLYGSLIALKKNLEKAWRTPLPAARQGSRGSGGAARRDPPRPYTPRAAANLGSRRWRKL
jgi:DNA photolyase